MEESINYLANDWLRYPIMGLDLDGGACPRAMNQGACAAIWRDAAVQDIAIKDDRAAVGFSNGKTIELDRQADGSLIIKVGGNAGRGFFK